MVAVFGSAGLLIAWDFDGKELWRVDLGALDSGWFFDPAFQWGHSSSPIIYRNSVILQADVQKGSYIAAWDLAHRQAAVEDRARRRDLDLGHADDRAHRRRPRRARDQRHQGARLRSGDRQAAVDARTELGDHDRHAGGRQRSRLRHRRLSAGAADLRDPPRRERRHLAAEGPGVEPGDRVEQHDRGHLHPDAARSTTAICSPSTSTASSPPTTRRPASARSAAASARAARSRRHRSAPTAASTSRARTARSTCVTAAAGLTQVAKNDMKEVIMATPAISDGLIVVRTLGHLYGIGN